MYPATTDRGYDLSATAAGRGNEVVEQERLLTPRLPAIVNQAFEEIVLYRQDTGKMAKSVSTSSLENLPGSSLQKILSFISLSEMPNLINNRRQRTILNNQMMRNACIGQSLTLMSYQRLAKEGSKFNEHIRALDLSCSNITNQELWAIIGQCPKVQKLDIRYCLNLTPYGLLFLTDEFYENVPEIHVSFANCAEVFHMIGTAKCPKIRIVDLHGNLMSWR